jgi:uncharacterized protein
MDTFGILSFSTVAIVSLLQNRRKRRNPSAEEKIIKVTEIWIYPIKSCGGIQLPSCKVTKRGFQYDRMLMVVDKDGKFISQRSFPKLSLVNTAIQAHVINGEEVDVLTISCDHMDSLPIPLLSRTHGPMLEVTVWGDKCQAFEIVEGSFWFREYLDTAGLKLVQMVDSFTRYTDDEYAPHGETGFSDGFPFLLTSQESLDEVNSHLKNKITMNRFRPNLVVSGCNPYAEDSWKSITFAGEESIAMSVVKPCSRCTIPNIDPATGIPDPSREPSFTMKKFRNGASIGLTKESWQKQVCFLYSMVSQAYIVYFIRFAGCHIDILRTEFRSCRERFWQYKSRRYSKSKQRIALCRVL